MPQKNPQLAARRAALIATAKEEKRPLSEWCGDHGFEPAYAASILRRYSVPFKGRRLEKEEKMLALLANGLDCEAIAKEMGLSCGEYVYRRLKKLGANPPKPARAGNILEIGGKRMSREVPRLLKMVGDLKRGMETGQMREKYGICRERVSQVRAQAMEVGLLP